MALNQLKYSGLFDAIRIRKSGYSIRIPHDQFIRRYKLCSFIKHTKKTTQAELCENLLNEFTPLIPEEATVVTKGGKSKPSAVPVGKNGQVLKKWVIGKSKVFIRTQDFKYQLEVLRSKSTVNACGYSNPGKYMHTYNSNKN